MFLSSVLSRCPIIPGAQNERLSAQQSLCLCPSQVGTGFMEQVQILMSRVRHEWIAKVLIPRTWREDALRRLFQMNVHPLSLFPGADGLGQFCAQKAELWDGSRQSTKKSKRDPARFRE
jgi:hypothetical protein